MTTRATFRRPVLTAHSQRSYWLKSADYARRTPAPPLVGEIPTPLAIVGGGLTGMWTAYRVKQLVPDQDVVILEADFCGAGASGRNGGQVHSWYESLDRLASVTDADEAIRIARATEEAIDELAELQSSGTLDMDLRLDGWLWTASSEAQEGAWDATLAACERYGISPYRRLKAEEIRNRTGSSASYAGVVEEKAGTLHPGKLCMGLRQLLLDLGVRIFEDTAVLEIQSGSPAVLRTPDGSVRADRVLIANNVWATSIPEIRRYIYAVESEVIMTEPVPELLDRLGWTGGESICDSQRQVLYYQRTADGRVQFGRGSGGLVYGDRIGARQNQNPAELAKSVAELRVYPELAGVRIEHDWTGAIDCVASHVPLVGTLRGDDNILYCVGWNGTGLAQIPAVSRILASRLLALEDEWKDCLFARQTRRKRLPPEPIRFIGGTVVGRAVARMNELEITGRRPDPVTRGLVGLMPSLG